MLVVDNRTFAANAAQVITAVSRKRAHGRCTLLCAQTGRWADICDITAFYHENAPMFTLSQPTTGYCTPTHLPSTSLIQFSVCVSQACVASHTVASEAYHDWSGEAADAQLRVNFTLKLLLSQNFCNRPLMRFIRFASNIGPAAAVPAGPAPSPLT